MEDSLIATLYAVRSEAKFWRLRDGGYNHIFPNGTNEWRDQPDSSTHRLLLLADGAERELKTTLEELMIQPRVALSTAVLCERKSRLQSQPENTGVAARVETAV